MHVNPAALPHSSFVSPLLFGRSTQLDTLRSALERTRGGLGGTMLVTGDAGVGKSRLIATARVEALESGFRVLRAGCFEPDASVPYAPLLELLAPTRADMTTAAAELAGFVADPNGEPEQERHRLFVALTQYFAGLSDAQPLLLIVEDIHWCDETSLQFLRYLARHIGARRIGLLLSYRLDADKTAPSLDHAVAELEQARLAIEVRVNPLSRTDVELMAGAILSPLTLRAEFVDAVFGLTEGNPFFTEEILAVLAESDAPLSQVVLDQRTIDELRIPRSVHDAVVRRLARVSPAAQRVARLGAVAGRGFDFALLQSLTQLDEADLLRSVDELVGVHLLVEESAERLAFRHALTRQAIYAQLLARERQALHGSVVQAMEHLFGASTASTGHLADLAYHAYAARDWPRVRDYSARMGDRAQRIYAPALAVEHFGRALEAAHALGEQSSGQLHRARAQSYEVRGEFEPAEADYGAALAAARAGGDRGAEWQGLLDLGFAWLARDYARAGTFFEQALTLAEELGDASLIARSLNRLGNWHVNLDEPGRGLELHERALATFRELGDPAGVAETLDFVGVAALIRGQRRQAIETLEQATAAYRQVNDRRGLASVLATCGHLRCASHVYDMLAGAARASEQALSEVAEALAMARTIGSRSAEAYAASELAACLTADGQFGAALAAVHESQTIAEELEHGAWLAIAHANSGMIALDLLDAPTARAAFEHSYRAAQVAGVTHVVSISAALLARAMVLGQDVAGAEAVLRQHVAPDAEVNGLTRASLLAAYGELRLVQGAANEACGIAERLIVWGKSFHDGIPARLEHLHGACLAALGQGDAAEGLLRSALGSALATNNRPRLWQVHLSLGRLLQSQARRREAGDAYAAARAMVAELTSTLPDGPVRQHFAARVAKQLPAARTPSAARVARETHDGLTMRERDVAALIGRGLTNADIAERLVISERTVESHTGRIYDKLGCTTRSQITAWAIARGLSASATDV